MTSPDSPAVDVVSMPSAAGAPTVVGHVELRASFSFYAGSAISETADADEALDMVVDDLELALREAIHHGLIEVRVQFRGSEAVERTPR